ncbi:MAG: hypothetical protein ACJ8KX_05125 [Chthoniobacterales bacterium]
MKAAPRQAEGGSTIVYVLLTIVLLGGFVALAVDYTSGIGRLAQRDRAFNDAVEIADGCLELAFSSWRQLAQSTQNPPTSTFTPVPTPSPGNFPSFPNATITNFRIQAVDPLITLSSDNPPISALAANTKPTSSSGNGSGIFSYFYLASVDVALPYTGGIMTAKVRRIFEKRFTSGWTWAMLYNGDLELHPDSNLTLNGWVHSNKDVYVGNGNSAANPTATLTLTDRLTYTGNYVVGFSPNDTAHAGQTYVATPNTPADFPPGLEQTYSPFGWDTSKFNTTDSNPNNDGFRAMIQKPTADADPFAADRLYNQAALAVEIDANNNIKVSVGTGPNKTDVTGQTSATQGGTASQTILGGSSYNPLTAAVVTNRVIQDNREQAPVRLVDFDVSKFISTYATNNYKSWNGIIYIRDSSAGTDVAVTLPGGTATTTRKRGVRIVNGAKVPTGGMTIVSDNPVYIQGDFNSGKTATTQPPSNTGDPTDPDAGTYTRQPSSIMADSVTLLSNSWVDAASTSSLATRIASNTTVNAALVAGNVPSQNGNYSGGGENFVRFLEDWTGKSFTYYGSMLCLFPSAQATGIWGSANTYLPPQLNFYFDQSLSMDANGNPATVPGYVSTIAYLQQQRWYLQY